MITDTANLPETLTLEQIRELAAKQLARNAYAAAWKREYYKNNREKVIEYHKAWAKAHPELGAARQRRYYEKNKDKKKAYYEKNREGILAKQRARRLAKRKADAARN